MCKDSRSYSYLEYEYEYEYEYETTPYTLHLTPYSLLPGIEHVAAD